MLSDTQKKSIFFTMKVVVIFHNIGGYHIARIAATKSEFNNTNWDLSVIQVTNGSNDHPWGDIQNTSLQIDTLLPQDENDNGTDWSPNAQIAAKRLLKYLEIVKPDVVVIPGWQYAVPHAALDWVRKHKKISILMCESKWNDSPRKWWIELIKSNLYVKKFNAAIVGGGLHRDYLLRLGFPQEGIFGGYDTVDNNYFKCQSQKARETSSEIRQQHTRIPTSPYFVVVTRFIPRKNVLRLVQSYAQYRQQIGSRQPWDLVICGSGQEEESIRQLVSINDLDNCVHLPGFLTYQEIPKWFGLASTFIHPALQEQWGLVVNEAMASGLPVLVSDRCGCFPELVLEGINGFGFDPENVEQLTELMLKMSSGTIDIQKMGEASQKHIQDFSPEHFAEGLSQAIQYAIRSNKASKT
jgi:1,2-diacylglycerol 3-alpha-glucosyltransferase